MNKQLILLHRAVKLAYTAVIVGLFTAAVIAGNPDYFGCRFYTGAVVRGMLESAAMSALLISGFALYADVLIHKSNEK